MHPVSLEFVALSPVSNAQWQVPLAYICGWVHAGKQTEVWVTNQRLYTEGHHENSKITSEYTSHYINQLQHLW